MYSIQIFVFSLFVFLVGLLLKEVFGSDLYSGIFWVAFLGGLLLFLTQTLLNSYFGLNITIINGFLDFLAKALGGVILSEIFAKIYNKKFNIPFQKPNQ